MPLSPIREPDVEALDRTLKLRVSTRQLEQLDLAVNPEMVPCGAQAAAEPAPAPAPETSQPKAPARRQAHSQPPQPTRITVMEGSLS